MSNPTDQPLTMTAERESWIRQGLNGPTIGALYGGPILAEIDATRAALTLLQSQFDNLRRDKEEGDRQNALILADYRKLREALKDKQRGMTFTESERNAELVRQVTETREQLAQAQNALKALRDSCLRIARLVKGSTRELLRQSIVDADAALRAKPEPPQALASSEVDGDQAEPLPPAGSVAPQDDSFSGEDQ